ncbi:PAS-domain containing protein [Rhizobacter fulvus]|jgi:diguanylate cyclase (GGDEF)-like protein
MSEPLETLRALGAALDGLDTALCAFDDDDRALCWNRSFLRFFPEHDGHVHAGEPYAANLRRFYASRLSPEEAPNTEQYVIEGLARHRTQRAPYEFFHDGRWLRVTSVPLPELGRVRLWKALDVRAEAAGSPDESTARFLLTTNALDDVADGVMVTDRLHRIVWANAPFLQMYGFADRAAAFALSFEQVFRRVWEAEPENEDFRDGLRALQENLRFAGAPFELPLPEGRWTRVVERRSADGKSFFAHVDITVFKKQQERLRVAEQEARENARTLRVKSALLEATLERMEQGVMMVNAERIVEVCNRRAMELLDLPPALMASRPTFTAVLEHQWQHDEFAHTPDDILQFVRAGGILDRPHRYDRPRPDGRIIEVQSVPIDGGGVLRTYTDITERKRAEDQVRHVARHDGLTSLVNRDAFLEALTGFTRAGDGSGEQFAVHFIDLDRFKPVNDRFGHAVGDAVLTEVAVRLRRAVREGDVVGRMGGDEFAVLQRGDTHADAAEGLAHRILAEICRPIEVDGQEVRVGASIGTARYPADGTSAEPLLRKADAQMYLAKATKPPLTR